MKIRRLKGSVGPDGITVFGDPPLLSARNILRVMRVLLVALKVLGFRGYVTVEGSINES